MLEVGVVGCCPGAGAAPPPPFGGRQAGSVDPAVHVYGTLLGFVGLGIGWPCPGATPPPPLGEVELGLLLLGNGLAGVGDHGMKRGSKMVSIEGVQAGFVYIQDMVAVKLIQILDSGSKYQHVCSCFDE